MAGNAQLVQQTDEYLMPNYGRVPLAMVKGSGARIWDADGKEYIDFFAGFGAGGVVGHCHPEVVAAIKSQAEKLLSCGNLFTNEPQVELAKCIVEHSFDAQCFFCHSGAEANETALKLTRLVAGEGRYKIISFHNCFHGRTMGALSLTPEKYQKGFDPMLPGNVKVPFDDIEAVEASIDNQTAGIIIEPIQGEGGVNVPSKEFMQDLRRLCDEKSLVLICDEVWTAPARTGEWFAYQHYGITPDIMTIGKAIGGGVPLAACVARRELSSRMTPGTHGCTLGGNPLCAASGVSVMKLIERENLIDAARKKGQICLDTIRSASISKIKDIRGKGLMIGIELDCSCKEIFNQCLEEGLIINCTQEKVIRIAPPLIIDDADLQQGLEILIKVLST